MIYHVLNQGNRRIRAFRKEHNGETLKQLLADGLRRYSVDLQACWVMPHYRPPVVRPRTDLALRR